jgi:hypothetical protein
MLEVLKYQYEALSEKVDVERIDTQDNQPSSVAEHVLDVITYDLSETAPFLHELEVALAKFALTLPVLRKPLD